MKKSSTAKRIFNVAFLLSLFSANTIGQTGAAGVGSSVSNAVWLDANELGYPNGFVITNAADVSGNGITFSQGTISRRPVFTANAVNGLPAITFDGINDHISSGAISSLESPNLTYFIVYDKAPLDRQVLVSANYASQPNKWASYSNLNNDVLYNAHYSPLIQHASFTDLNSFTFISQHITPTQIRIFNQGNLMMTKNATYTAPTGHQVTRIGDFANSTNDIYCFNGHIAEVIIYNTALNALERVLVENYLGAKYGMTIPTDLYDYQATHNIGLVAVGNNGVNTQTAARGSGILEISNPNAMGSNEYLLAAHPNVALSLFMDDTDLPPTLVGYQRWQRTWRVDEVGEVGNLDVTFYLAGGLNFGSSSTYTLLVDNATQNEDFVDAQEVTGTYDPGTQSITFNVNLAAGDYLALAAGPPPAEVHAIQDGLWSDPATWDCVCVPSSASDVYIDPFVEVTVDIDAETKYFSIEDPGCMLTMNTDQTLSIYGDWDILGPNSLSLTDGEIQLVGTADQYVDGGGVTIEFNDLLIDNPGNTVTFYTSQYILNGTLTPVNGTMVLDPQFGNEFIVNSTGASTGGRIGETIGAFTFTGNYSVRRFIPPGVADYRDMSSAVGGAALWMWDNSMAMSGEGFPDGCAYGPGSCFYSVKRFNNFQYNDITNPNLPLTQTHGWEIFMGDDLTTFSGVTLTVTGTLNSGSIVSPAIGTGWSIQGNPFPSDILWSGVTKGSQVDNYFYVYDNATGAYEYYDGTDNSSSIPELANGFIASSQGFWTYDWGSLTFNQSAKTATPATFVRTHGGPDLSLYLKLYENNSSYSTTISIQENIAAEDDIDTLYDVRHLSTVAQKAPSLAIYSLDNELIRKNYIKDDFRNKSFDLFTEIKNAGYHTIEASNLENFNNYRKILLFDHLTGEFIDLKIELNYTFYSEITSGHRFTLILTNAETEGESTIQALTINESVAANGLTITQMGNTFNIESPENLTEDSQIKLINVLGQQIVFEQSRKLVSGSNLITIPEQNIGVYILVITTGDKIVTKKVVL